MYTKAVLEIIAFDIEDVITTSVGTPSDDWADVGGDTSVHSGEK